MMPRNGTALSTYSSCLSYETAPNASRPSEISVMAPMTPYGTTTDGTQPIGMLTSELLPRNWNVWVVSRPRSMTSLMPPLLGPALIHCDESWIDDPRLAAHSASPLAPP